MLVLTTLVILDNLIGRIKYSLGGAIVLLKLYYLSLGQCLLKAKYILNIGTSELIYGLIIITHNAKILEGLKVDYVHVLDDAHIVRTGDGSLVNEIIEEGFRAVKEGEAE